MNITAATQGLADNGSAAFITEDVTIVGLATDNN